MQAICMYMIIGFLGKGGSGKSTLATALVNHLFHMEKNAVLAIDADHNMDLAWNLTNGIEADIASIPYLGESIADLNEYAGINENDSYKEIFYKDISPIFSLNPADPFTSKYQMQIKPGLCIMASGPHTETVLQGNKCSHSLSTALKAYLPLLQLKGNEAVVVDEKASSDAAGTGIPTGFTISFIVVEATPHSIKAAQQIAKTLDFHNAPYEFILNKADPAGIAFAESRLPKKPFAIFPFSQDKNTAFDANELRKISLYSRSLESNDPWARKRRSAEKFENGRKFAENQI